LLNVTEAPDAAKATRQPAKVIRSVVMVDTSLASVWRPRPQRKGRYFNP
jgi:hypothetical protein